MESIETRVATIDAKLNGLIILQASDSEAIKQQLKDNNEYLKGEVHHALNSHAAIKERLLVTELKINELERKEYKCPIDTVMRELEMIKSETEESRAKYKFSDIRKGMKTWEVIKSLGLILFATAAVLSLVLTIIQINKS